MSYPLNPAQKKAVEHQNGPLLVLAGAGSGKTRVITQRIARLVERGVPAQAIVALTFTNKAAGEMAERVAHTMKDRGGGQAARAITISTFHSFGLQVLTRERSAVGGTFTIFDQGDCLSAVKEILARLDAGKRYDAAAITARISNAKNAFVTDAAQLPERDGDPYDAMTKMVFPRYQSALRSFRAYDFDDLVCEVARLWSERADVLARWRERFRYVLVDEYQDTNRAQLELVRQLAGVHRNICVVGDDDQSIYAWRGADVRNILDFEEHFPGAEIVKLEQNYRSARPILDVANAVISQRSDAKHRKVLFTEKAGGARVRLAVAATPEIEAQWIARELRRRIKEEQRKPRDLAVLYRSNGQAKAIEETLRAEGVPYRVVGGQQFFERKEVKDVLGYLKLALNRVDEISLRRVINYPPRGIGETSLERLALHAVAKGWTLWQALERVDALDDISGPARDGCKQLEMVIADARRALLVDRRKASDVARELCDRIGLRRELDASSPGASAASRRWANVEGLFNTFARREIREGERGGDATDERSLGAFLHALTLQFDDGEDDASHDLVTLSTLHGSKGLEFDVVYLVGCEEGLLPHARTLDGKMTDVAPVAVAQSAGSADIEEERRLFYVGITRAREALTISRAKARAVRGKPAPRTPSRFLSSIPTEMVDEIEIRDEPAMSVAAMTEQANALLAALNAIG